jgi:hypothetical protein
LAFVISFPVNVNGANRYAGWRVAASYFLTPKALCGAAALDNYSLAAYARRYESLCNDPIAVPPKATPLPHRDRQRTLPQLQLEHVEARLPQGTAQFTLEVLPKPGSTWMDFKHVKLESETPLIRRSRQTEQNRNTTFPA